MDRIPPLRHLRAFLAVARNGSIQSAAAELNVTQPAVSQAVKSLEEHCGARLLDRGRRPAQPTEAGRTLARTIAESFGRIEETIEALRATELSGQQTVTVACSVGIATYWLMPRLAAFYDRYPDVFVNVVTTQSGAPLLSEGVDLAIRYGHGRWSDGTVTPLFAEVVEPQCSPALRARLGDPADPQRAALIHVRSEENSWVGWPDYLARTGQPNVIRQGQTYTNYVQATQAALEGRGLVLGWRSITGDLVAEGRLVPAGLPPHWPSDGFHLVARPKRRGSAAETFARWLGGLADTPGHHGP